MRYVYPAAATGVVLAFFIMAGNGGSSSLSITNYQLVSEERVTRTEWYYTYRADLVNPGQGRTSMTASVSSLVPSASIVPGRGVLHFSPVPANGTVTSSDTFTIMVDRNQPFSMSDLQWSFLSPTANAGPNQTATVGSTVTLNGSGSADPGLAGPLTYQWSFKSRAPASQAVIVNPTSVMPSFVVDVPGSYIAQLTVSNGAGSDSAQVVISTINSPPVALAGPNQTVAVGATVTLNGSGSSDVDGDPLTYQWALISRPAGSVATLQNGQAVISTFVADKAGTYVAQLVANDGKVNSVPSTVTIYTSNVPPVANAGANQVSLMGSIIQLDGSGSTDVDGDPLTYNWSLITKPQGSNAALSSASIVNPTFTADKAGIYVAQLIVNDGKLDSLPSTTTITTSAIQAPTANAGPNQTVVHGMMVHLNGSGTDPQGKPLTYAWSLVTRPPSSSAVLSSGAISAPDFLADQPGTYVAQLIVNNGTLSSAPATVTITTTNTAPVAVAGPGQVAVVGATVTLDGSASSDADSDPLTFAWSMMSRPASSAAVVTSPLSKTPTVNVDAPGTYVIQLIVNDGFTNSSPVTTTITVNTMAILLTPNPLNLTNSPKLLHIALGAPASAGGQSVSLLGFDPAIISVPNQAVVPEGATSIDVTVTPVAAGSTLLLVTSSGFQPSSVTVNVTTPTIAVSLSAGSVGLTRTITGTVTLSGPAPPSGTTVSVSAAPAGLVTLDTASVVIPAGSSTGTFAVTGASEGTATITGSSAGYISGSTSVLVAKLGAIILPAELTLTPGQSAGLNVTLATAAPQGGALIQLVSSDPAKVTVDSQVFIAQGNVAPVTPPQVNAITFGSAVITASASGFVGASETVKVGGALSFSSPAITVGAGGTQNVTLLLTAPAPAVGLTVTLHSSNPAAAIVPGQVTFTSGQTSTSFNVTGVAAGSSTLTATSGIPSISNATATVSVLVYGAINVPSNVATSLGGSAPFLVTLTAPAPAGGVVVQLSSSDSATVGLSTSSVTIDAGNTQPAVQPQVTGVNLGQATITAIASGWGSSSALVKTTASLSFVQSSTTLTGTETKNLTLTLSAAAPIGGVLVNLSASPTGFATIPALVQIAQGTTSVPVAVTGVAPGVTTITASTTAPNVTNATTGVTVQSAGSLSVESGVTVAPGQSAPFDVALPSAAASPVTVSLVSGDPSKLTVSPSSVTIATGQTKPAQKPTANGVAFGSAVITASAPGYGSASQTFTVGATLSLTPQTLPITGTATQNLTLTLSAPAPGGGLLVNLSSSQSGIVTIAPSVTIAAGATTVPVPVTGVTSGTTTITASTSVPNVPNATATVTVQSAGSIALPVGVVVAPGETVPFQVTLPAAAPSDVTVTLSSGDDTKVKILPASVIVVAGQTQPAVQPNVTGAGFGAAMITASAPGYSSGSQSVKVAATLNVSPPTLTINGTATQDLTLTLSAPAPAGGLLVNLSASQNGIVTIPASVTIAAGATKATAPVTGVALGTVTITASPNTANVPPASSSVTVQNGGSIGLQQNVTVGLGQSAALAVTLSTAAPTDTVVTLSSADTSKLTIAPATVTILAGQTQPATQPQVTGKSLGTATINASAPFYASGSRSVQITGSISFSPQNLTITGTETQNLTLTLSGPAPTGGLAINVSSSDTAVATVTPATVTIPENLKTVTVPVKGVAPGSAVVTASAPNLTSVTAAITVKAPIDIIVPATLSVAPNDFVVFPMSLAKSQPNPVFVTLSSSDPTTAAPALTNILIPADATQWNGQIKINGFKTGSAIITASAPGLLPATCTVQVGFGMSLNPTTMTLTGIGTQKLLTITLTAPAPAGGVVVTLTSSDPSVATGPSQPVTIQANSTSVSAPIKSTGVGSAVIHATSPGLTEATANVTVEAQGGITIAASSPIALSNTTPLTVTLSSPAPAGGVTVNLASSDPNKVEVLPASVVIPEGGLTSSAFTVTAVNVGSATINATATGYNASNSLPITVNATLTWTKSSLTLAGIGKQGLLILSLSAPGPVLGLTVTLTSTNPGVAGVQQSITFWPDGSSHGTVNIPITSVGVGTAEIHASGTNIPDVTANVTVTGPPVITTTSLPDGMANVDYSATMAATGGASPLTWSATGLPSNLVMSAAGQITGKPAAAGSSSVVITVTDSSVPPLTATKTLPLVVAAAAAPATITVFDGSNQTAEIKTAFAKVLKVSVKDVNNNGVSGATVTFTVPGSGASGTFASGNTVVTDALGFATTSQFTANSTAGAYSVVASVPGVATPATFLLTNTVGPAASIAVFDGSPQSAPVKTLFAKRLKAVVKDSGNNPVSGVTVTFTKPSAGASGTFAGAATASTDASGVATSGDFTANDTAGGYSVTASVAGVATSAAFLMTNTSNVPSAVTVVDGSSQSAPVNTAFAKVLKVLVKDDSNNPVSGATVTFTPPGSGASGTFAGGNTAVSDASGIATSAQFTANNVVGAYSVSASTPGATPATFAMTNLVGPVNSITVLDGSPQSTTVNTAFVKVLKVVLKDSSSNPISGLTVTFTGPGTGASGVFAGANTAVSDASGIATSSQLTANAIAGAFTVAASVPGLATTASFQLTNVAGPPASITVSDGSPQSAPIHSAFAKRLKAFVKDASNNPVMGATVTFTAPGSNASGSFTGGVITAVTDAAGIATSEIFTANAVVGSYTVAASVPPVAAPANFSLTNTADSPASIAVSDGSGQSTSINTAFTKQLKAIVKDIGGNVVSGVTVTFSAPGSGASGAFAGNVVTATTDASGIATSAVFTANDTTGTYSVTASVPSVSPSATFTLTNTAGPATSMAFLSGSPQSATVATAFANPLRVVVKDAKNNLVSGVTVTFTPPDIGVASGTFTGGNTAVTDASGVGASKVFTANTISGAYTVTASSPGLPSVTFSMTNVAGAPSTITSVGGSGQSTDVNTAFANPLKARVKDAFGNALVGALVTFSAPASGPSGAFAGGTTVYATDALGVATTNTFTANATGGNYNVTATVPNLAATTTFALTNTTPSGGSGVITVSTPTIGKNLQTPITIQLSPAAPAGTTLTVTSSNANLALLGAAGNPGTVSVSAPLSEGATEVSTYVKALAGSGNVTITVSATGYANATAVIALAPSGFVVAGSQGIGGNFTTYQGVKTMLTVYSARLNGAGGFAENQEIRSGYTATVPVTSTPTSVGTISPAAVSFTGGTASATAQFSASAVNTGNATIAVTTPADFTAATTGGSLLATVQQSGILPFTATVGNKLQVPTTFSLAGATTADVEVTVRSDDSSKLKFSTTVGGAGLAEIKFVMQSNRTISPEFYVQGFASTGSVGYTVDVPGFGTANGTVTLAPSGFVIKSVNGIGQNFVVVSGTGNPTFDVDAARISAGGSFVEQQMLAGGLTVSVGLTVGNPSLGLVNPTSVTVLGGTYGSVSEFQPVGPSGSTTITAATADPAFSTATGGTVGVTIQAAVMIITGDMAIGKNLQQAGSVFRTVASPTDLPVTITSSNPALVRISATPNGVGTATAIITIPANQTSAPYYVQSLDSSGTATYTVHADGFPDKSGTISLAPSGLAISGSSLTLLAWGPQPIVTVSTAMLDPVTNAWVADQPLSGAYGPVQVDLASSLHSTGTVETPVTVLPGNSSFDATFTPAAKGSPTTITIVSQPAGWTPPTSHNSLSITVL